jgi:ribonucleoside-diphosphate reductase alpha chain
MDDVIDLEEEKIDKILEKIENDPEDEEIKAIEKNLWLKIRDKLVAGRRTGLSGIGLADTLASLGIPYSSDKGISLAEEIYKQLAITAYKSSIDMANDRGAFPIWSGESEMNNPFLGRVLEEFRDTKYQYLYEEYGRRNIACLTIPPSGTISLLAGISSGIEPVYQLSYKRRRKVDPNHPNISFIDKTGDCWEEYDVLHPKFKYYIQNIWDDDLQGVKQDELNRYKELSPYKNSTAYELNPLDRVKMQGAIQKWVDHSISSTINLPEEATEEDVANIYMEAWKQGCKGITIYRDGSRDGVLISSDDKEPLDDFLPLDSVKRSKVLDCEIFYGTSKGIEYNVVIGLYKNRPYEVFATTDLMVKKHTKGELIKVKRGHYKVNGDINRDHLMENMSHHEKAITRACSAMLRHRMHVKYVVDFLYKTSEDDMTAFNKMIARVLKRFIKDKEEITGSTCENCGSSDLIYKDGCSECQSCGSSKCS